MDQNTFTILNGGVQINVTHIDSKTESVKVRQIPLRKIGELDTKRGDEAALVELFCDKSEGFADDITHESVEEILRIGEEINRPFLERHHQRLNKAIVAGRARVKELKDLGVPVPTPPQLQPAHPDDKGAPPIIAMPLAKAAAEESQAAASTASLAPSSSAESSPTTGSST